MKRKLSPDAKLLASLQKPVDRLISDTLKSCRAGTIAPNEMLEVIDGVARHQAWMKRRHTEPETGSAIDDIRKRLGAMKGNPPAET